MVEQQVYRALGLSDQEYKKIVSLLKREPKTTELAMFSVEWSEHCGYPSSKKFFSEFPRQGKYPVIITEDAGGIVIDGIAVIFKMESHNHPSQIEPKQGAATGVGGIIRDIFTCGARPVASLDSLRFGSLSSKSTPYLLNGVVDGISFYGNVIGVPTVGGELYFDKVYQGNCLVNVFSLGILDLPNLVRSIASGEGNLIMYVGAKTGRDGIGGCSVLASQEILPQEEKRPSVQIADPFTEKCLIEATLEAIQTGWVVGIKDMGAAGLTCSTSEMAASGEVGMEIELSLVPQREEGMQPWEIMMSESQERMLVCVKKGREKEIEKIFKKWDLEAVVIGKVISEKILRIKNKGEIVAQISPQDLVSAPQYDLEIKEPEYLKETKNFENQQVNEPKNLEEIFLKLLGDENLVNKFSIFQQYDHMVQTNTIYPFICDAAIIRIKGSKKCLAITTDGNGYYCYLNPYRGAQIAVAEASRNLSCTGAEPAALTDCLNFGNPHKPQRYWQFVNCIEGMVSGCKELSIPIVSGNVSFYNENPSGAIYPTVVVGMVGIIEDIEKICSSNFKSEGDLVYLLGENDDDLGGSYYLKVIHRLEKGEPKIDLEKEKKIQEFCRQIIKKGLINSAHDCSEGGIAQTLAECCLLDEENLIGVEINYPQQEIRKDSLLFGETQGRIIISCAPEKKRELEEYAKQAQIPLTLIGKVGGERFEFKFNDEKLIDLDLNLMNKIWRRRLV